MLAWGHCERTTWICLQVELNSQGAPWSSQELPDSGMGTQNMERLQKLTERRVFFTLVGFAHGRWSVENETYTGS